MLDARTLITFAAEDGGGLQLNVGVIAVVLLVLGGLAYWWRRRS